jgi:Undecaprenyl-phosphate glucose phosphotransferase
MIKKNQRLLNTLLVAIDAVVMIISFTFAWLIKFESGWIKSEDHLPIDVYIQVLFIGIPVALFMFYSYNLYTPARRKSFFRESIQILTSNMVIFIAISSVLFILKEIHISRTFLVIFASLNIILTVLERITVRVWLRSIRKKGFNVKHILIVGGGELGKAYMDEIHKHPYLGYQIYGILDDDDEKQNEKYYDATYIGCIDILEEVLTQNTIDEVIIGLPLKAYDKLSSIISTCEKTGVRSMIIPDYLRYIPAKPEIDEIGNIVLINSRYVPLDNFFNQWAKRAFDVVFSSIALLITLPFLVIISLMVVTTSKGDLIFKQKRVGYNKKEFMMYKFRSMAQQEESDSDEIWTKENDPRTTKIGAFIRKTSLDEFPQFVNVLKGDMSVVGPRPERPYYVEQFKEKIPQYMVKHHVKPGVTGWAQVNGWRGDTSIQERINHDIYYIENWSFVFDIQIVLLTLAKGLIHKNAY